MSDLTIVHAIIYVSTDNSLTAYKSTSSRPKKITNRAKKVTHKIMKARQARLTVRELALGHGGGSAAGARHLRLLARADPLLLAASGEPPWRRRRRSVHRLADPLPVTGDRRRRDAAVSVHLLPVDLSSSPSRSCGVTAGWEREAELVFGEEGERWRDRVERRTRRRAGGGAARKKGEEYAGADVITGCFGAAGGCCLRCLCCLFERLP